MRLTCKYRPAKLREISEHVIEGLEDRLADLEGRPIVVVAYEAEDEDEAVVRDYTRGTPPGAVPGTRFNVSTIMVPTHGLCLELEIVRRQDTVRQARAIAFTETAQGREVAMAILQQCDEIDEQNARLAVGLPRQ